MKDSGTYGFYLRVGSSNGKPGLDVDRDASFSWDAVSLSIL
jgi:hypothetical protein